MITGTKTKITRAKKKLTPILIALKESGERRVELRSERDDIEKKMNRIENNRSRSALVRGKNDELQVKLADARKLIADAPDVSAIREDIEALNTRIEKGEAIIRQIEDYEKNKADREKHGQDLIIAKQRVDDLEVLVAAFGPQGIKKLMLVNKIGLIEDRANQMSEILTGGEYKIILSLDPEFHVLIENDGNQRPLALLSKSEGHRMNIILQESLCMLTGFKVLIIDDADSLDEENRRLLTDFVLELLNRGDYVQAFIACHYIIRTPEGDIKPNLLESPEGVKRILIEDGAVVGAEVAVPEEVTV
jgi:DNA repair exonuclease SbcCD ATPase subunit